MAVLIRHNRSALTSVGTAAILRFVRPVCYQDSPQQCLPAELKDENPRNIFRLVNGHWTREAHRAGLVTDSGLLIYHLNQRLECIQMQ